jgi:hypothetical protein
MRVLGIEFAASNMNYVLVQKVEEEFVVIQSNRLSLGETRAVLTTFNDTVPDRIAIKEKPEKGAMQAGAAAMKMEGIVLANAPCPVEFVSGARINKSTIENDTIHGYLKIALKAAVVVLDSK